MRIPELMVMAAVVANAACPGFDVLTKQDADPAAKQNDRKQQPTRLVAGPGPRHPQGEECRERTLHRTTVQEAVTPSIVRIESETTSGSGFVLASPRNELLIVTNAHIVGDEERINAVLLNSVGERIEVSGLELVLDDPLRHLVLLRAPRPPGAPQGLYVNPVGVRMNQDVVAMGYPPVARAITNLSFSSGRISALNRELEGRTYLQTHIELDPSLDGGPVVDACGAVVGSVIVQYRDARRITLIVPGSYLLALHDRYIAPRENPSTRIRARTAMLEQSLKLQKGDDASEVFSRQFLRENVWGAFLQFLQQAKVQEEKYAAEMRKAGMVYADEPFEKRAQFLSGLLPRPQYIAWYVGQAISLQIMNKYEGLHAYLAMSPLLPGVFGALNTLQVVDVLKETETSAVARVRIVGQRGTKVYDFQWKLESGDWHIARLTCVSGCHR